MSQDTALRAQLKELLVGHGAHAGFDDVVRGFPPDLRGKKVRGLPYSAWQILEHLRISQWDLLEYSRDPKHVSPKWPEDYWPKSPAPPSAKAWEKTVADFRRDRRELVRMVEDPATDLFAVFPWSEIGATLLREVLLAVDHNAYHVGQLVTIRRLLGAWPPGR